jgi:hypothetical protein
MGNSSAESRYPEVFSAHRGCGNLIIMISADRVLITPLDGRPAAGQPGHPDVTRLPVRL